MRALGLDGCAGGWVAVCLGVGGRHAGAGVYPSVSAALEAYEPGAVGIDMPIGLTASGLRQADIAARQALAGAASSVFNAPARAVVDGYRSGTVTTYAQASELNRRLGGKGLSQQTWRLVPRIAEVDALAAAVRPLEVHPEVSFRLLAGGARLAAKRSWNGLCRRRALLAGVGVELAGEVDGGDRARADDVLDAAVVAWTAAGALAGESLRCYPCEPAEFDRGLPIAIRARSPEGSQECAAGMAAGPSRE